ncbi:ABC-type Fe(3+)-siderophore transport system permease component [Methanonatronarchaeum thermophilum]|uniref:ABC-type Fe(3+)-siderophore transport system permease component n=1 Tax=Methanonatronarchaeum thermophilum TaxID=1927129 RepID=A0A1Y3GGV0_9EURY|nr:iron chelate uptake ABC transporter family permease subunit [Methanonatronarchaeum thermophilum]OUJ19424.1 ABC-type Fe(3+)-siderophore transport system permease component [Methanonatronarchaeum thermophilum]
MYKTKLVSKRKGKIALLFLLILTTVIMVVSIGIGPVNIPVDVILSILLEEVPYLNSLFDAEFTRGQETIVKQMRLPRVILGGLVGAALGTAGALMQGLFKNPLADPYIVGLSSGAGLGAAIAIMFGITIFGGFTVPILAFISGIITIFAVYFVAKKGHKVPVDTLLLAGVAFAFFLSALTSFIMYFSDEQVFRIMYFTLGGLAGAEWSYVFITLPLVGVGVFGSLPLAKYIDAIMLGEEEAMYMGVRVEFVKKIILVLASLVTAASVAFAGIIGFVGLIPPHIIRILLGPRHKILIPASALLGALFLVISDTLARVVMAPTELPVGIVTALFGAPFFIYLLWKRKEGY